MNLAIISKEQENQDYLIQQLRKRPRLGINPALFLYFDKRYKKLLGDDSFCANFEALGKLHGNGIDGVYVNMHAQYKAPWVVKKLLDFGIDNIYIPYPAARLARKQMVGDNGFLPENVYHVTKEKPFIGHLEIHVVDRCNLNCKSCTHYSPISQKQSVTLDGIKKDIHRFAELFDNVLECWLLGGEPFLEPDLLMDVIGVYRSYFPNSDLNVVTNGLLVPELEHPVFEAMRDGKVRVKVSNYEPTQEIFPKVIEKLEAYGLSHTSHRVDKFFVMKTDTPAFDPQKSNDMCNIAETAYLMGGKLSKCPESLLIKKFDDYFGASLFQDEAFDIYDESDGWALFDKLLSPIAACGYCNVVHRELRPWARYDGNPSEKDWLTGAQVGGVYEIKDKLEGILADEGVIDMPDLVNTFMMYQKSAVHDYFEYRSNPKKQTYILFGAGQIGKEFVEMLDDFGISMLLCDNSASKHGACLYGVKVISPSELKALYNPASHKILVTSAYFAEIARQLNDSGIISDISEVMPADGALNELFAKVLKSCI